MKKIIFLILLGVSTLTSSTSAQCAAGTSVPSSTSSYTQPSNRCINSYLEQNFSTLSNKWTRQCQSHTASDYECRRNTAFGLSIQNCTNSSICHYETNNNTYYCLSPYYGINGNANDEAFYIGPTASSCETLKRIDGVCNASLSFTQQFGPYPFNPQTPDFTNGCTAGTQGSISNIGGYRTYTCNGVNGGNNVTCGSANYNLFVRSCNQTTIPNNTNLISFNISGGLSSVNIPGNNMNWTDCSRVALGNSDSSSNSCIGSTPCAFRCDNGYNYNSTTRNCQSNTCVGTLPTGPVGSIISSSTPPLTITGAWTGGNGTDACTYKCANGYTLSGNQCIANTCTGSIPSTNATISSALPLINNTPWSTGDGITACTYTCNNGYFLSGGQCMRFDCSGNYPTLFSIRSLTPPIINNTPWNLGDGITACTYRCQDGYLFNGSACVAPSCDMTSLPAGNGTKLKVTANNSNGINLAFVKDRSVCGYSCMPGWEGPTCQTFSDTASRNISLSVEMRSTLTTVKPGDEITITLTYRNQGSESASNVSVVFTGGSGLTNIQSTTSHSRVGNTRIFDLGTLGANTSKSLSITATIGRVVNKSWIINEASISSTNTSDTPTSTLTLQTSTSGTPTFNSAPIGSSNSIQVLKELLEEYENTRKNLPKTTLPNDTTNSSYKSSIQTVINYGIMNGYRISGKSVFNPTKPITYCEWNTIIDRVMSIDEGPALNTNHSSCTNKNLRNRLISQEQAQNILINRTSTTHSSAEIEELFDGGETLTREIAADIIVDTFRREKKLVIGNNDEFIQGMIRNLEQRGSTSQRAFLIKLMQRFINMDSEQLSKMGLDKKSLLGAIVDAIKGERTNRTKTFDN